jgi:hypothetical protein
LPKGLFVSKSEGTNDCSDDGKPITLPKGLFISDNSDRTKSEEELHEPYLTV